MVDHNASSSVPPLAPAAPGRREPLELASRILSVLLLGWLGVLAVLAWLAYRDGYTDLVLPVWNSIFILGIVPIVSGIFARRMWAQRWVVGIAMWTGLSTGWAAVQSGSTLLWGGALLLLVVVLVVRRASHVFNDSDGNRGRVQQTIAMLALIGSIAVNIYVRQVDGSERGRELLATEIQAHYTQVTAGRVRVYADQRNLVIEAREGTVEEIDATAELLNTQLQAGGKRARAWVVGFESVIVTNGSYARTVTPYGVELTP